MRSSQRLTAVIALILVPGGNPLGRSALAADPCVFEDARLTAPIGSGVAPRLGTTVSMSGDGQTIVATEEAMQTTRVYRRTGAASWTLEATLPGSSSVGRLGASGSALLLSDSQAMKIWTRSPAGSWSITSTIVPPPGVPGDVFDISGDGQTVAVGAPQLGGSGRGAVYVFRLQAGSWVQDGPALLGPLPQTTEPTNFGGTRLRLDADGDTLVVGAVTFNAPPIVPELAGARGALPVGALAVYRREGGAWTPTAQVLQGTSSAGSTIGIRGLFDLSDDGQTIVAVQALEGSDPFCAPVPVELNTSPAAFVFARVGDVWSQRGEPLWPPAIDPVLATRAQFEVATSHDASRVVISIAAPFPFGSRGRGFVFDTRDGLLSRRFEPLTSVLADDGSILGLSAAISADGSTVALGAPNDRNGGGEQGWGSVLVYTLGSRLMVTSQPVKASVPGLGAVNFSCAASARVTPQYRWTLDGVALTDGVRPDGTMVSGSGTPTLSLTGVAAGLDGAVLACDIAAACETERTSAVSLRVTPACIQDLNNDGVVNTADLAQFLAGFGRVCP